MAYVAVNKDGAEYLFELKPSKLNTYIDGDYWVTPYYKLDTYDHIEYTVNGMKPPLVRELGVELPKGSIQKLIGRELTWDDEPMELAESINEKICSECGRGQTHHKIMFFLKERAYLGTEAPHGMSPELYRKSQYDFGFDYSTSCRVKKKQCECGNEWYEKVD